MQQRKPVSLISTMQYPSGGVTGPQSPFGPHLVIFSLSWTVFEWIASISILTRVSNRNICKVQNKCDVSFFFTGIKTIMEAILDLKHTFFNYIGTRHTYIRQKQLSILN